MTALAPETFDLVGRPNDQIVLVEKHIVGKDYRLVVLHGRLIWAIEREPGGVVGDGRHSVRALLDVVNARADRGTDPHAPLKRLTLDEEAISILAAQDLEPDSCPAEGRFVRLRRTANIANGGRAVPVFDCVHPDNARLAERAATALRLDLAGIDLLIPDIRRSWRQGGAAVCEVNAQPFLGQTTSAHLYAPILKALTVGHGRIPIAVVVGAAAGGAGERIGQSLARRLSQGGAPDGLSAPGAGVAWVADDRVEMPVDTPIVEGVSPFDGAMAMLHDRECGALVLEIADDRILGSGLPFDRFDVLIIASSLFRAETAGGPPVADPALLHHMLQAVLPMCGVALILENDLFTVGIDAHAPAARLIRPPMPGAALLSAAAREMAAADRRYAQPAPASNPPAVTERQGEPG